jgi:hypothetical protein
MTKRKDELERLSEKYPDVVRKLLDGGYSFQTCPFPEGFASSPRGQVTHLSHIFRKTIRDSETPERYPVFFINAVICDASHLEAGWGVSVVFSVQLFHDEPINLYLEQMQEWEKLDMIYPEEAFAQAALIALHNRDLIQQRRAKQNK